MTFILKAYSSTYVTIISRRKNPNIPGSSTITRIGCISSHLLSSSQASSLTFGTQHVRLILANQKLKSKVFPSAEEQGGRILGPELPPYVIKHDESHTPDEEQPKTIPELPNFKAVTKGDEQKWLYDFVSDCLMVVIDRLT